jgi:hypothetical protein
MQGTAEPGSKDSKFTCYQLSNAALFAWFGEEWSMLVRFTRMLHRDSFKNKAYVVVDERHHWSISSESMYPQRHDASLIASNSCV